MIIIVSETSRAFEKRLVRKKVYGVVEGNMCRILADCDVLPNAMLDFIVPLEAAEEYFNAAQRRCIQDIFPELSPQLREVLITGTSPAEYDEMCGSLPEDEAAIRARYEPLGYRFETD